MPLFSGNMTMCVDNPVGSPDSNNQRAIMRDMGYYEVDGRRSPSLGPDSSPSRGPASREKSREQSLDGKGAATGLRSATSLSSRNRSFTAPHTVNLSARASSNGASAVAADAAAAEATRSGSELGGMDRLRSEMAAPAFKGNASNVSEASPRLAPRPDVSGDSPKDQWTVDKIAAKLANFKQDIPDDHAALAAYMIESTKPTERRVRHGADLFAHAVIQPQEARETNGLKVQFKQHPKNKKDNVHYVPICIKSIKERVPVYRFHHTEIGKNILTPNTMLTFVPHLRDLEGNEESIYHAWVREIGDNDVKSGFKPMTREDKIGRSVQSEYARSVAGYLESWLTELAIPGCNKSALIRHMAQEEPGDDITPQQRTDILNSHSAESAGPPGQEDMARMFSDAFNRVFADEVPLCEKVKLSDVLRREESVDNIIDSNPVAKDLTSPTKKHENEYDFADHTLATYSVLGCLICFSHSCEHGEYDNENYKHTFSLPCPTKDVLMHRQVRSQTTPPNGINGHGQETCRRECYRDSRSQNFDQSPFSDKDRDVMRALYATTTNSTIKRDPICLLADILNRTCVSVHDEFERLGTSLPRVDPEDAALGATRPVKKLSWYDRHKKVLVDDWENHIDTQNFQKRDMVEPCFHDGPCRPKVCRCVDAGLLCERFCGCTPETCAYKFTGCGCRGQGKLCQWKRNDKSPCICIQLNRECDPALCGECGAFGRADPKAYKENPLLASTGCQNCVLQRGAAKALLLGQSQLEGVGYGLFTAEDISQDEFVIEYVGELISHDEGVRREARRGDIFNEGATISYLFTLLEHEGIWVDAAIYGNLSRYINHAPSGAEKRGCNITPRIQYVNGEYRIKFEALRDIKAGEELFFDYGEEFPNLTKKLLDEKTKATGRKKTETAMVAKHKAAAAARMSKDGPKQRGRKPAPGKSAAPRQDTDVSEEPDPALSPIEPQLGRKRKRELSNDSEADEEYQPNAANSQDSLGNDVSQSLSPASKSRLRERSRKLRSNLVIGQTPPGQPKPKSKRGGYRPGSGRPRKHPRPPLPVSKPPSTEAKAEMAAGASNGPPVASPAPVVDTPTKSKSRTPSAAPREIIEISDSDNGEEDDDSDQSVLSRRRASRNRRLPAKLRDAENW